MTHQSASRYLPYGTDAGRQLAQLRHVLALVEQLAGRTAFHSGRDDALDQGARLSGAYDHALPVVQRRFDILASETAAWAATGVEALLSFGDDAPKAAAAALADELDRALGALGRTLST
jgi:hypothetical protein